MLCERIKKVRKALNLTQQEFATRISVKRNTVATYEMGRSTPSDSALSLICREFGVSETWLRTGEGEMFAPKEADAWEEVVKRRGLSAGDRLLLEKFMDLKPAERQAVMSYVLSVAAEYAQLPAPTPPQAPPAAPTFEEEARAEAEEYYRRLLLEKKQAGTSSRSSGAGGETA